MKDQNLDWLVIGAGPAGIAAVGKLIDAGISPHAIGWMDPHFTVGDLGKKWFYVPGNTSVALFLRYMETCHAFDFKDRPEKYPIEKLDPKDTCLLQDVIAPLQWITDHLKKKVQTFQDTAMALNLSEGRWEVKTKKHSAFAKNIILAIGSEPKSLSYPGLETISLETALDLEKLNSAIHSQDTIGVFGSSHSAILVLANLFKTKAKKILNFYRSPHKYAVFFEDWILFDDIGLKGFTAKWARQNLDKEMPKKLQRVLTTDHEFEELLSLCNKVIYATGFEKRKLPILEQYESLHYDDRTGIIAPGLFGLGIAFPQAKFNRLGHLEHRVGLWKFMDYLNAILPIWLKYGA